MAKILNKYKIFNDELGYVNGFSAVLEDDFDYYGQMADFPNACEGWTKFVPGNEAGTGEFVEDLERKAEIEEEKRKEALKPTDQDRLEAQTMYTALMTDTLLPDEEDEEA